MKQEELLKTLIEELFGMDNLHHEYTDNNISYVIDSQKEGNTLTIKVSLKENKDKKEFEKWLENVDNDLFSEVLNELEIDGLYNLESIYNSENYKDVIDKVKNKTKKIANRKIKELQKLLN